VKAKLMTFFFHLLEYICQFASIVVLSFSVFIVHSVILSVVLTVEIHAIPMHWLL